MLTNSIFLEISFCILFHFVFHFVISLLIMYIFLESFYIYEYFIITSLNQGNLAGYRILGL